MKNSQNRAPVALGHFFSWTRVRTDKRGPSVDAFWANVNSDRANKQSKKESLAIRDNSSKEMLGLISTFLTFSVSGAAGASHLEALTFRVMENLLKLTFCCKADTIASQLLHLEEQQWKKTPRMKSASSEYVYRGSFTKTSIFL